MLSWYTSLPLASCNKDLEQRTTCSSKRQDFIRQTAGRINNNEQVTAHLGSEKQAGSGKQAGNGKQIVCSRQRMPKTYLRSHPGSNPEAPWLLFLNFFLLCLEPDWLHSMQNRWWYQHVPGWLHPGPISEEAVCFPRFSSVQFSRSVVSDSLRPHESQQARSPCPSPTPGVYQTHVHWVSDTIQPYHPLSSPSPPSPNPSQHQDLFQWVNSSHEVAKVLELQLQHKSEV